MNFPPWVAGGCATFMVIWYFQAFRTAVKERKGIYKRLGLLSWIIGFLLWFFSVNIVGLNQIPNINIVVNTDYLNFVGTLLNCIGGGLEGCDYFFRLKESNASKNEFRIFWFKTIFIVLLLGVWFITVKKYIFRFL